MSLPVKIIVSLIVALVAATLTATMFTGALFEPLLLIAFAASCLLSVLLGNMGSSRESAADADAQGRPNKARRDRGTEQRESGKVKWFNVSKGFGFIIKDDGEEIFVHFRSIRDGGRRGLREGQRVSFVVTDSDKGPQAEDVASEQ